MYRIIALLLLLSFAQPLTKCSLEDASRSMTRPEKEAFSLSPTGHFMIHYDIEGDAAPDLTDVDANGVPDYVDEVGIIADSTRKVLTEVMGFRTEVDDVDGIYDIYIMAFGTNYYGVNVHEGGGKSYIKIDNDYASGFYTSGIKVMRLTVAHEFFHAIQRAYKETQSMSDQFFYELTSTWIEDIIVPDGDDYLYWLNDFFNNPQQSWEQTDGYSLALFGHYLSTQFEVITSEKESTIMRKVWENISNANTPSDILDGILQNSFNSSFQAAWLDFVSRNLFNDVYTDMNNDIFYYVDQGNELCTAPPTSALFIDADDSVENNLSVTNNTVTIKTIKSREDAVIQLSVVQSGSGYLGNIAYFLDSQNQYSLIQNSGADFVVSQFEKNEMLHFIYISPDTTTSIGLNINISVSPDESKFLAIYPNPIHFGDSPILQIEISTPVIPQIKIYNLLGAEVVNATILPLDQGRHNVSLTPLLSAQMPSGVYVMDVMVDNKIFTRKFTLIK